LAGLQGSILRFLADIEREKRCISAFQYFTLFVSEAVFGVKAAKVLKC
jgi:hypothetical protein